MVRTVGIDADDFAVKAVELDGSYRKSRLVGFRIDKVPLTADDETRAAAVANALDEGKLAGEVVFGFPCREAVLRTIDVPFRGADAIRKVIKSEVESAIHSHQVDDMVVDFHELGVGAEGSKVLVAAVPKPALRGQLAALVAEGVEPERVDLDTMALYRLADWCGALSGAGHEVASDDEVAVESNEDHDHRNDEPPAKLAAPAAPVAASGAVTVVVDLGARSTRVLLVDNGRLVDMRTLRLGDAAIAESIARADNLTLETAREAVAGCLATGGDYRTEVAGEQLPVTADKGEAEGDAPPAAAALRRITVAAAAVDRERLAFLQRLARELTRFLAAASKAGAISGLWITGSACRLAGMREMLREVFGVEVRELDVLGRLKHSLSPEEAETAAPQLAIAIGLALANLGGPVGFDFRREDLAFTRGFDRIKSALAITCMLAVFAAVVYGFRLHRQLETLNYRIGQTYSGPEAAKGKEPLFFGLLGPVVKAQDDRYYGFPDGGKKSYTKKDLFTELLGESVANRVRLVRDKMRRALEVKQKESGIYEEVSLESGLAVIVRFLTVLKAAEPAIGKYLLTSLELNMRSSPTSGRSGRFLQCRFAFRGNDFRERFAALRAAVDAECKSSGSPFEGIDERVGGDLPFKDGAEKGVPGAYYDLKIHIRESFAPFGVEK